jgi:hypothetical protein
MSIDIKNNVIVIDDVVSIQNQNNIEKMLTDPILDWKFLKSSNYGADESSKKDHPDYMYFKYLESALKTIDGPQLVNQLYSNPQHYNVMCFPHTIPLLCRLNLKVDQLLKVKANITPYCNGWFDGCFGVPHTDYDNNPNLVTGIYYVNDCDGDTVIFNETSSQHSSTLTVRQRISPKKGRIVLFDGNLLHAKGYPSNNNSRIVLNINFLVS